MATPPPVGYDLRTGIGTMQIQFFGYTGSQRRALIAAMRESGLTVYGSGRGFLAHAVTISGTQAQFETYGQKAMYLAADSGAHPGTAFLQMMHNAQDEARGY